MASRATFTTKVIPGDVSLAELRRRVSGRPNYVRVGLPDALHEDTKITIAELGAIHEYGAPKAGIPERPFLHPAIREGLPQITRLQAVIGLDVQNGKTTKADGLERLGLLGQRLVQQKIRHGEFVPLKPATIARKKGSTKPLIDTGQMMQSVTFAVES
jgi:hypothetical protein